LIEHDTTERLKLANVTYREAVQVEGDSSVKRCRVDPYEDDV